MIRWMTFVVLFWTLPVAHGDAKTWVSEWIVGAEGGLGVSSLISDRSVGLLAGGLGKEFAISASTRNSEDLGLKIRFDHSWLKDWTVGTVQFSEFGTTSRIEAFDRGYSTLAVGVEGRKNEDHALWIWDALVGFAFTDGGEVILQSTDPAVSQLQNVSLSARSAFGVGGSYGYRRRWKEKWFLTTSVRTFVVIPPVFDGAMGGRAIFSVPVLFTFAIERQLF